MSEKTDRRTYLKVVGGTVGGLVVGGAIGYLAKPSEAVEKTITQTQTLTKTVTATAPAVTTTPVQLTGPDHALIMLMGGYRPDMVQANLEEFDKQWNVPSSLKTELQQLSGDLMVAEETKLAAGAPVDICLSYPYSTVTWSKAGWIQTIDDIKATADGIVMYNMGDIKKELFKNMQDAFSVDGKLYGLPYYNSCIGAKLTNEKLWERAGISGQYPKTHQEFYDMLPTLKAKCQAGEYPFLAPYYNEAFGIPWSWLYETMNQGGVGAMFEETPPYGPTFDVGTLAEDVLKNWKDTWDKEYTPHSVLTMKQTDFLGAFSTGKYFIHDNADYYLGYMNNPAKSQMAGDCGLVPVDKQPWGMMDAGIYVLVNRKGRTEKDQHYAEAFMEFLGYKDRKGVYYVPKRWGIEESLQSGYAGVTEDPDVKAAYAKRLRKPEDLVTIGKLLETMNFCSAWKAPWYTKWNTRALTELPLVLTGEKSIKDVITTLRDYAEELVKGA